MDSNRQDIQDKSASVGSDAESVQASMGVTGSGVKEGVAFAALRHRDFRAFFVTNMLSMMADSIEHVISYWVIFQLFRSPALAGFAVISHWTPHLLFSVYFGMLADRFDCRRVIQLSQMIFMVVSLTWGVLFLTGNLQIWHTVVLLTMHGLAGSLWAPGSQLIIHDIVGREHLQSAVRLSATGRQLGILFGPAIGGALMLILGPSTGLLVNALFYLPLIFWLQTVSYTGHRRAALDGARGRRVGWKGALEVLGGASGNRVILSMDLLAGCSSFLVGNAFQAQMPGFAHDLGTDEVGFGYSALLAANAAGAVVGGILLEGRGMLQARARTAIVLTILWCLVIVGFSAASYYPVALTLLFFAGIFNLAYFSMAQTLVQLHAPSRLRGRLIGLFIMAGQGLRTFSGVTVGVLGSFIGIHWSLGLSSGALLVVTVALLAFMGRGDREADTAAATSPAR